MQRILKHCFVNVIFLYGVFSLTAEIFFSYLPYGLILVLTLYLLIQIIRIPAPHEYCVETIVGQDLWLEAEESDDSLFLLKTVAHRGAALDAPENSLEAFKQCAEKGCLSVEFDVALTADGVPIVFHDRTLERIVGSDKRISRNVWADLSGFDIAQRHALKEHFHETNIPTLDATVTQLLKCNQRMFIDLKSNNTKMVKVILDLFNKYPDLHANAVVSSFFPNLIYLIRRKNPKIVCSLAWRPYIFSYKCFNREIGKGPRRDNTILWHIILYIIDNLHNWLLPRITYYILGISMVLLHKDVISGHTVMQWRKKGIRVIAWTVNSPIEKQYLAKVLRITYMTDTLVGESFHKLSMQ